MNRWTDLLFEEWTRSTVVLYRVWSSQTCEVNCRHRRQSVRQIEPRLQLLSPFPVRSTLRQQHISTSGKSLVYLTHFTGSCCSELCHNHWVQHSCRHGATVTSCFAGRDTTGTVHLRFWTDTCPPACTAINPSRLCRCELLCFGELGRGDGATRR